jgi:Fe-S cluster biogenesis protein NfuA
VDGRASAKPPPSSRSPRVSPGAASEGQGAGGEDANKKIMAVCRDVLAPLIRADGGEMYIVKIAGDDVHIHLSGACSGCPGASSTRDRILAPILTGAIPKARVVLTTGVRIPEGATKLEG